MIIYILICLTCILGSGLTFFSGFGLGTILTPVFGIFFPIEIAIALTAIVHFLNNIFKFLLVAKNVNKSILKKFGIPSIIASLLGAYVLSTITHLSPLYTYSINFHDYYITPVKLTIAILLIFFSLFEIIPFLSKLEFGSDKLILGGLLSGFFGGLSGNQGALRSAFLIRSGLSKESFIATGVAVACLVDITRLGVYANTSFSNFQNLNLNLLLAATLSAFLGALIGNKLLKKVSLNGFKIFVSLALFLFAVLLGIGFI
jgi:uncharacterized membrane protein YfcA